MTISEGSLGLARTISHSATRVGELTSAKVAARKITGGRVRGMKVLAYNYEHCQVGQHEHNR